MLRYRGLLFLNPNLHPFEVYQGEELVAKFSTFEGAKIHAQNLPRPRDEEGRQEVVEVINFHTGASFVIAGQPRMELSERSLKRKGVGV